MKHTKFIRVLSFLLVLLMVLEILPITGQAASVTYYQTSKANVPIWSSASSKSDKVRTISQKGTIIKVIDQKRNIVGNLWYKLSDGTWVYSENVTKHSHSYEGGICTAKGCGYEWPYKVNTISGDFVVTNKDGAKIMSRPYSKNSTNVRKEACGKMLYVKGETINWHKNTWYQLSDGNWVYSGDVLQEFTVRYDTNGGKGNYSGQTFLSGKSVTIPSEIPVRDGYIFKGWATSLNVTKAEYKPGATYSAKKSVLLYAVWGRCAHEEYPAGYCKVCGKEYQLTIDAYSPELTFVVTNNEGAQVWSRPYSGSSQKIRIEAYAKELKINGKTKNWHKNTWYRLSDGNWVYSGDILQQFAVEYNANGGENVPAKQTFLSGKTLSITSEKPTRDGYIFKGWATSKSSSEVAYKAGATYSGKNDVTLYAVWQKCAHKEYSAGYCKACGKEYKLDITEYSSARTFVVINDEGAQVWSRPYSGSSQKVRIEDYKKALKITGKTKNSHGNTWYRLSDGNWVYSEDIAQQFTVKYNANGGENAPSKQTFLSGKELKLTTKKPTRDGYVFQGWATSKSASKVEYKSGATYSNKKSVTMYAVWKKCAHEKYEGGYCTGCGVEYKLEVSTYSSALIFVVKNKDGAKIKSRPYADRSVEVRVAAYKKELKITGKTKNVYGNIWYQLSDGNWVYSGDVVRQYKVTYDANGGKGAPSAQTFLSGEELKLATKAPTRGEYTFQGWSTSPDAKTVDYVPGAAYSKKADLKLYAVWSKCTHTFQYGICKDCKYEWAYETVNVADAVYAVTNSNGSSSYARPYAKSSEKQTTYKKGNVVVVTHKATNENGAVWYKLKDGKWMKESDLKKQTTFNTIGAVTASYYTTLSKGDYSAKKITGKWYYLFTYDGKKVYIPVSAFTGESDNTKQLSSVSETLTKAVNKHATTTKTFLFHKKTVEGGYEPYASKPSYDVYIWDLYKLKATAGSDTADALYTDCTYNDAVHFVYTTKVQVGVGMVAKWVKPSKASEYEDALYRGKLGKGEVYPQFTVSVTKSPAEYNSELKAYEFTGYFQNYKMEGKGYAKKSLDLKDYVDMFTSSVSVTDAALALVKPDAAILKSLYKLGTTAWSFSTKSSAFTSSSSYSSKKISLTLYDEKTDTVYRVYKANIKSPICLQTSGDYLQTTYTLYKWSDGQTFDIDLKIQ